LNDGASEYQLIVAKKTIRHIIKGIYDELYEEGIFFVFENRGKRDSSLSYKKINYGELLKIARGIAKRHPCRLPEYISLLMYLADE